MKIQEITTVGINELFTGTKASTCKAAQKTGHSLGASATASCKAQGLMRRDSKRKHRVGNKVVKVGGTKLKGEKYGGDLPDYNKG